MNEVWFFGSLRTARMARIASLGMSENARSHGTPSNACGHFPQAKIFLGGENRAVTREASEPTPRRGAPSGAKKPNE